MKNETFFEFIDSEEKRHYIDNSCIKKEVVINHSNVTIKVIKPSYNIDYLGDK